MAAMLIVLAACSAAANAQPAGESRLPGSAFMGRSTQEMQRDDSLNPGMLWVQEGEALWQRNAGKSDLSCASCHGDAQTSMRGVAARYPAFDATSKRPLNLGQRINQCRQEHQQAPAFAPESEALLGLESYIALQSRGMPVTPPGDAALQAFYVRGEQRWRQRIGQLNLSCAQCHDENWGKRLGGSIIPQGHAGGYPIYRLEWQAMGSLQRRLRNCMTGVRAEPFALGSQELVELELYLAKRAKGMAMEAPGVRP
ncbi:MAG TPA: sulfur oxidation c-type cytochrome SoxA [Noviherbaspirillum sp.]|jgi:sulfur-oxidizing protein SoxA|uniref:sulfur oxidation c-type cytochrome SoxA n=1 Tax=Noviherbaspirillum sp. TaxID=1926288 RepID=UPI002DDD3829|nr:sulfur oxidation c-type cytochrome SoxA [Noviherbaspirillum sp.]HEV2610387.1 sulfur oxidation c-type cytochrome SoxA [Noviherbaspirillum sp.]